MSELLKNLINMPTPFNMIVLIVLVMSVAGVISSITKQIRKYVCHRQEIEFKRELVDRGLPISDIERIVSAKSPTASDG